MSLRKYKPTEKQLKDPEFMRVWMAGEIANQRSREIRMRARTYPIYHPMVLFRLLLLIGAIAGVVALMRWLISLCLS